MHYADAKSILSPGNGMNVYRGCTHGCIYCDSRSVCYGMTHAFEDVEVKRNAPALLEAAPDRHFPGLKERYIREYGSSYELPSPQDAALMRIFYDECRRNGFLCTPEECFAYLRELPDRYEQTSLF